MNDMLKFLSLAAAGAIASGEFSVDDMQKMVKSLDASDGDENNDSENDLVKFAKGAITPEQLSVSGTITPRRASLMIDLIQSQSSFLSRISVIHMDSLSSEYDVWDMANGILVRVAEGAEPTEAQKKQISNAGRTLTALPAQLFADLTRSTILSNQWRPNLTGWLDERFSIKFGNEMVKLGFDGVADDYANTKFNELNKGWIYLAQTEADTVKSKYSVDGTMVQKLERLVQAAADDMPEDAVIFIHRKDVIKYASEVGASTNNAALIMEAAAKGYGGYSFEVNNKMPRGVFMLTPLKNLVLGVSGEMSRDRVWNARKRAVEYTFDVSNDYDIAVPKFVVHGSEAAPLVITSYSVSITGTATSTRTVTGAEGGIAAVTVSSADESIATVSYNTTTGVISVTGVSAGTTIISVTDGINTKNISVTVS